MQLGLANYTTGKGKMELRDSNIRPIEIFMCSVVSEKESIVCVVSSCGPRADQASRAV